MQRVECTICRAGIMIRRFRRFISADNIIVTGTSVEYQNVNLYEYCSDNPINFQDPSGHFILSALAGAGAYFFEAIVSLGASYLFTKATAGGVR